MFKNFNIRALFYGLCGLIAYSIDQVMNYEFMIGMEGRVTSLVIAVPIAGLLCSVSLAAMNRCLKKRDLPNALLLLVMFFALGAFSLGASIYRAGETYDAKLQNVANANKPILMAQQALDEAKARWRFIERDVQSEVSKGGCGRICRDKKVLALQARQNYETARKTLLTLGTAQSADPMAKRLSSVFNLDEKQIQIIYPLLLPIGIWLASIAFTGMALNEFEMRGTSIQENDTPKEELPLSLQIANFMDQQEELDGKRPTQEEAAKHFGVSRSTISRRLAELKQ